MSNRPTYEGPGAIKFAKNYPARGIMGKTNLDCSKMFKKGDYLYGYIYRFSKDHVELITDDDRNYGVAGSALEKDPETGLPKLYMVQQQQPPQPAINIGENGQVTYENFNQQKMDNSAPTAPQSAPSPVEIVADNPKKKVGFLPAAVVAGGAAALANYLSRDSKYNGVIVPVTLATVFIFVWNIKYSVKK